MKENINFLYCFDTNYNLQAFTSMISLLDCSTKKINIYVIHNENNFELKVPNKILNHKNLILFESYQFDDYEHEFPNIKNVHISVATYFRLFIENYLPKKAKFFIFLDPDVICIKDPINEIENTIEKLKNTTFTIAAKTEHNMGVKNINVSDKYFNAGVMLIDYEKWQFNNFQSKLIKKLKDLKNKIVQWDQDVLNSMLDGEYLELKEILNFKAATKTHKTFKSEVLMVHYMGSHKPWLTSGIFQKDSNYYHSNYRKVGHNSFHIEHKWRVRSAIDFFFALITFRVFRINRPFIFIYEFIVSILKNKN